MRKLHIAGLVCVVGVVIVCIGPAGCAGPTQTIQRGKDLSSAGILYVDALDKLLNVTIDTVIDYDSDELLRQRKYMDTKDLRKSLDDRNEVLIEQVKTLEAFRSHGLHLKAYFVNLQALANAELQDSAAAAVESLSSSISTANETLEKSNKVNLNEEDRAYLSRLSGLLAKSAHAGAVRGALERDAPVIGEQLVLHEKLLEKLKGILEDRYTIQMDLIKNQKIRKPYLNTDETIGTQWKDDRKQWIRSSFYPEELAKATEAIRQMRFVWGMILQGEQDMASLQLTLSDIHDFAEAVHALHEAGKEEEN